MNPDKISRFLKLLTEDEEENESSRSAVDMFHYVMMVEAMYLQMMTVYHAHNEDMDALVQQMEMFAEHAQVLTQAMSSLLQLETDTEEYEHESQVYTHITGLGRTLVSGQAITEVVPFVSKATLNKSIFSSKRSYHNFIILVHYCYRKV